MNTSAGALSTEGVARLHEIMAAHVERGPAPSLVSVVSGLTAAHAAVED